MRVQTLIPDASPAQRSATVSQAGQFGKILDDLGTVLGNAEKSENAFAAGAGDLQTAVYERARADVALSVASAAAQRTAQALQSILNMQV